MKKVESIPPLSTLGPRADACRYVCQECGGELRWTEPLRTPSVPLHYKEIGLQSTSSEMLTRSPCSGVYTHTHTCRLPACSPNFPVSPTFLSPFLFEPLLNLLDLKATLHLRPSRGEACTIKSHKVFWSPTQTPQPKPQTSNLQPKGGDTSCSREGRLFKSEHKSALWSAHSLMLRGRSVSSEFGN